MKLCVSCGQMRTEEEFHKSRTGQFSYCKLCRNAYDRRYYAERGRTIRLGRKHAFTHKRYALMAALKESMPCTDCGLSYPAPLMHWDHLPGYSKLGDIASLITRRPLTVVMDELKKCELV